MILLRAEWVGHPQCVIQNVGYSKPLPDVSYHCRNDNLLLICTCCSRQFWRWCGRSDSNRHSFGEQVFETCASTGSATPARCSAENPNRGFIPWTRLTFESVKSVKLKLTQRLGWSAGTWLLLLLVASSFIRSFLRLNAAVCSIPATPTQFCRMRSPRAAGPAPGNPEATVNLFRCLGRDRPNARAPPF